MAADFTSSDDSDNGGADDFFGSSPDGETKSEPHKWKHKPSLPGDGCDEAPSPPRGGDARPNTDSEEDRYSYSSESETGNEKRSGVASESASSSSSDSSSSDDDSSDDDAESDEEKATGEWSHKTSSASTTSEAKSVEKQTFTKKKAQRTQKVLDVSLLDLFPKSLSLVGLSSGKDETKEEAAPDR